MEFTIVYPGLKFDLSRFRMEQIYIESIAHSLSNLCRFGGHTNGFYSVAQHSVLVSRLVSPGNELWGLLHDSAEAYLTDIPRPLKNKKMFCEYRKMERKLLNVIAARFSLPYHIPKEVGRIDDLMLVTEADQFGLHPELWSKKKSLKIKIDPWSPRRAEREFIARFNYLCKENKWITR